MTSGGHLLAASGARGEGADPTADFLRAAGADGFPHAHGRTLLDHLLETRAIVRRWGEPWWVQEAAALHSVYSTDVYRLQLLESTRRDEVRELVGGRAERLAHLFCVLSRRSLFALADGDSALPERAALPEADHPESVHALDSADLRDLLVLHLANEAEQAADEHGGPGQWLATVSRRATPLALSRGPVPPIFGGCGAVVDRDAEARARAVYLQGTAQLADAETAWQHFRLAIDECQWIGEPCVWRAYLALRWGRRADTMQWSAEATRRLRELGVAWDKRLRHEQWLAFAAALGRAAAEGVGPALPAFDIGAPAASLTALIAALAEAAPAASPDFLGAGGADRRRNRQSAYLAAFAHNERRPLMNYYPGLPATPWHDPSQFPIVAALESAYDEIRAEVTALPADAFHRESERISRTGDWDVLIFWERGQQNVANCERCPVTSALILEHPTVRSLSGLIYVSRMKPQTHIAAHCGPTNMRVRCHLGLSVPEGDCAIRVGADTRGWVQGGCVVFDDFFDHEAWNHTDEERIVLIVDLWHPDLSPQEIAVIEGLQRYAAAQAESLNRYWAANARAKAGAFH